MLSEESGHVYQKVYLVFISLATAIWPVKLTGPMSFCAVTPLGDHRLPVCVYFCLLRGQYCASAANDTTVSCLPISSRTAASMLRFPSGKFCASQRSRITPVGLDLVAK